MYIRFTPRLVLLVSVVLGFWGQHIEGMDKTVVFNTVDTTNENGLLIFLDDSEDDNAAGMEKIGAVSQSFLCAFIQQAGPIIVSASVIDNVREYTKPDEKDPQKLFDRFSSFQKMNLQAISEAEVREYKSILLSMISFNKTSAELWIIKKINPELYLLLPKTYLHRMNIDSSIVKIFTPGGPTTRLELQLGLRVNHMETISDINNIKKQERGSQFADYFMDALYNDIKESPSDIFITNSEYYYKYNYRNIPTWSINIVGHGLMGFMIAGLSIAQFKGVLSFLEFGIHTKLLYYITCYGAGVTNKLLYEDTEKGVDTTYPFAIINQAIADAPVMFVAVKAAVHEGKLVPTTFLAYDEFIKTATAKDLVDYRKLISFFTKEEFFSAAGIGGQLPQIKYPGLPWFSVVDTDKTVAISSILAKTRIEPLDIANFFAKRGKRATPMGILLYTHDIPFELIVNTKTSLDAPPIMISMIPGNAVHHIKKISSLHTAENVVFSFCYVPKLLPQKIFRIDELSAINTTKGPKGEDNLWRDVIISLTPMGNTAYYMQHKKLFKIARGKTTEANSDDAANYSYLMDLSNSQEKSVSSEEIAQLQKKASAIFEQKMTYEQAYKSIIQFLGSMPSGVLLRLPKMNGLSCPPDEQCWINIFVNLAYAFVGTQKVLWFDVLDLYNTEGTVSPEFKNIIIDASEDNVTILATHSSGQMIKVTSKTGPVMPFFEDYLSYYESVAKYFAQYQKLPAGETQQIPSIREELTPAAVSKIEKVQKQKLERYKRGQ